MNKAELNNILDGLRSMYGNDKFPKLTEFAMDMWYEAMKDLDFKQTKQAIANYIKVGKFPPTIADIREQYSLICTEKNRKINEIENIFSEMERYYPGGHADSFAESTFLCCVCDVDKDKQIEYAREIKNAVIDYVGRCEKGMIDFGMTLSQCIEWAVNGHELRS